MLATNLSVMAMHLYRGTFQIPQHPIRSLLALILVLFLVKGSKIARIIVMVLCSITVLMATYTIIQAFLSGSEQRAMNVLLVTGAMGGIYLMIWLSLFLDPDVRAFYGLKEMA